MSGIRPRGSVGVAWQAMKDAKTGEETASPKGESKADSIGDAVPEDAPSSIGAVESTSKRVAKEKEKLVSLAILRRRPEAQVREPPELKPCQINQRPTRASMEVHGPAFLIRLIEPLCRCVGMENSAVTL